MEMQRASRMSLTSPIAIPQILVEDQHDQPGHGTSRRDNVHGLEQPRWTQLATREESRRQVDSNSSDTSPGETTFQHPLSHPESSQSNEMRQGSTSGFSFELYEPEYNDPERSPPKQHQGMVGPSEAREMLDDSIWMESIRRSATLRRTGRGSYRFGDLG